LGNFGVVLDENLRWLRRSVISQRKDKATTADGLNQEDSMRAEKREGGKLTSEDFKGRTTTTMKEKSPK